MRGATAILQISLVSVLAWAHSALVQIVIPSALRSNVTQSNSLPTMEAQTIRELRELILAKTSIFWIVSAEEQRVERTISAVAEAIPRKYAIRCWDVARGTTDILEETQPPGDDFESRDPDKILDFIANDQNRTIWILRDFQTFFNSAITRRKLRNLARTLPRKKPENARVIVILSPTADIPLDLRETIRLIEWPLPDKNVLAQVLSALPEETQKALTEKDKSDILEAALGLTVDAAKAAFAVSLAVSGKARTIDAARVAREKRRVVAKGRGITWLDPEPRGLAAIGGLNRLKGWLQERRTAYTPEAQSFGIAAPRGLLVVGLPGTGKSLTAKAVAAAWGIPLLRLDLGGTRSKYVGESESNIREALRLAETVGRCVLWLDEVEKGLAGSAPGVAGDGGVASDALGTLLQWMQERTSEVFVVATANDVQSLPPELLRKGRFDDVFFVGLPTQREREEILAVSLKKAGRNLSPADITRVSRKCDGFVGSEIAELVPSALFTAFHDGMRQLTADDLIAAAEQCVPLKKTAAKKIEALQAWAASGAARPASDPEDRAVQRGDDQIQVET